MKKKKPIKMYESFEKTLTLLKNKGMDALLIAGDFTDLATENAYGAFCEIYDKVFGDEEKPIPLYIMGNHDYWLAPVVDSWRLPHMLKCKPLSF